MQQTVSQTTSISQKGCSSQYFSADVWPRRLKTPAWTRARNRRVRDGSALKALNTVCLLRELNIWGAAESVKIRLISTKPDRGRARWRGAVMAAANLQLCHSRRNEEQGIKGDKRRKTYMFKRKSRSHHSHQHCESKRNNRSQQDITYFLTHGCCAKTHIRLCIAFKPHIQQTDFPPLWKSCQCFPVMQSQLLHQVCF